MSVFGEYRAAVEEAEELRQHAAHTQDAAERARLLDEAARCERIAAEAWRIAAQHEMFAAPGDEDADDE